MSRSWAPVHFVRKAELKLQTFLNSWGLERETNKMQLTWCLLWNFYLNLFRASLCPSSGEQDGVLPHMVFCTGCAGCGCVELGRKQNLLFDSKFHTVHTACDPAPYNDSQRSQCRTPYAEVHGLVLLIMGIMMPETWWDRSFIINNRLFASCWFLSLHPTFMMHGHKSLKFLNPVYWGDRTNCRGRTTSLQGLCFTLHRILLHSFPTF